MGKVFIKTPAISKRNKAGQTASQVARRWTGAGYTDIWAGVPAIISYLKVRLFSYAQ